MTNAPPSILVIRGGAIGDFILTLPVLSALRRAFPQAHITLLGYPHIACLARAGGLVNEVRPIEARGLASFFVPNVLPPAEWAEFFGSFELILSYLYDPDLVFQSNVALCSQSRFLVGPHRPAEAGGQHATEAFLKPLEQLAILDADPVPRLTLESMSSHPAGNGTPPRPVAARSQRWLAAHPGSGSERKNWPENQWRELLSGLAALTDWHLLLVGGEVERDRLQHLASAWPASRLAVARCLALDELARRLAGCAAFVGHDSGITHLAAALGLPSLVLWSQSTESVWGPRNPQVRLLRPPAGLVNLEVEVVGSALRDLLTAVEHA